MRNEPIPGKLYICKTDFAPFLDDGNVVMFLGWQINAKPRDIRSPDVSFAYPLNSGVTVKVLYENRVLDLLFYELESWPAFFKPILHESI